MVYTEADLSSYNRYAYTYQQFADEIGLDLSNLIYSPVVLVIFDQSGFAFTSNQGPLDLIETVDKYIHKLEENYYSVNKPLCYVQNEFIAENHFDHYMPIEYFERYNPEKDETGHELKQEKQVSEHVKKHYELSEPEKSFSAD